MKYALVFVALILPGVVFAQNLDVFTGDHGRFTRIVVQQPTPGQWSLETDGPRQLVLTRSPNANDRRPDLTTFYDRIDRARVASVMAEDSGDLSLGLNCECQVTSFTLPRGYLVLDISDPTEGSVEIVTESAARGDVPSDFADFLTNNATRLSASFPDPQTQTIAPLLSELEQAMPPTFDIETGAVNVSTTAKRLLQEFEGALHLGALTPRDGDTPRGLSDLIAGTQEHDQAGIRPGQPSPDMCRKISDLTDFSELKGDYLDLRRTKVSLVGLDGEISESALTGFAKSYLALGWGQEVMALAPERDDPEWAVLAALASSVETGDDPTNFFARHLGCGGAANLWALLSRNVPADFLDESIARRAYQTLPEALQLRLAPHLAKAAKAHGINRIIEGVTTDLAYIGDEPPDAYTLATHEGSAASSREVLKNLTRSRDDEVAAAALLDLAETTEDADEAALLAPLAAAIGSELAGTDAAGEARAAELSALIGSGEYRSAFKRILEDSTLSSERAGELAKMALRAGLSDADDARFLEFIFDIRDALARDAKLPEGDLLDLSERAIDLGIDRPLDQLLEKVSDPGLLRRRTLLEARIALSVGDFAEAELLTIALDGPDAREIRRAARTGMEDFAFLTSGEPADDTSGLADEAAILAEAWDRVSEDAGAWAPVSRLATSNPGPLDPATLDDFESLLEESEAARSSLGALLTETSVSP
ncbi:hypothetical protein SAMN05421759_10165 [Roseivivax lentus]|uniref:HEAT repeat domain-containing protein n=1 Tax=Roseivivax lentus TaxID=633194 RepID=A0A1N7JLJ6_9RHOB|nr:hypothetical protein [Roseivivax lentus]SIS50208.1 hypothetical protein SAMN05421759_10165 [Roseivivax lentus]